MISYNSKAWNTTSILFLDAEVFFASESWLCGCMYSYTHDSYYPSYCFNKNSISCDSFSQNKRTSK